MIIIDRRGLFQYHEYRAETAHFLFVDDFPSLIISTFVRKIRAVPTCEATSSASGDNLIDDRSQAGRTPYSTLTRCSQNINQRGAVG